MGRATTILAIIMAIAAPLLLASDFPEVEGWSRAGAVKTFDAAKLWEHINGAAEIFIQFGFEQLQTCELSLDEVTVTVSVYDMGNGLNAFGVFRTELPGDAVLLDIGAGALVSPPYQCQLLKDRYYVKIDAYAGEISDSAGTTLLEALAAALPGSDGLPEVIQSLPQHDLVAGSQRYVRTSYQGLRELTGCVYAKYRNEAGESYEVFKMLVPTGGSTEAVWQKLAGKWTAVEHDAGPVLAKMVPYRGLTAVLLTDDGIIGVTDCPSKAVAVQRLRALAGA